ncbi:hypothetical protein GF359_05555 [candidate division WOR-3 bacterium]|uniref:DNA-(apurinic or apyrimidinic site) lyase n=1 Tax=candidate division WOR-3 bacterium TaxID=2052148 RepID=A0A9D5QD25_UNCW3|nr:hypothetical protein [candidate division WOR-3 bacterium]MBD3364662.1 hypothetical protein [candidate division WOR-3 bacterium]
MPELPELEVLRENLENRLKDRVLRELRIRKPYIQKTPQPDDLFPQKVTAVSRRGKYIIIDAERNRFIIHLMLSGRMKLRSSSDPVLKSTAAVFVFCDSFLQLTEEARLKRMSLWIVVSDVKVDDIKPLGPEPLSPDFTPERFSSIISTSRQRLKSFLVNQRNMAGIGNAYADEICWEAGLSPFRQASKLTGEEIERVYAAIGKVLREGISQIRRAAGDSLDIGEKRGFMKVHRRKDEPCPRCGKPIAWVSTTSRNTYYCPGCQTGGKVLKDGRRSRFLK